MSRGLRPLLHAAAAVVGCGYMGAPAPKNIKNIKARSPSRGRHFPDGPEEEDMEAIEARKAARAQRSLQTSTSTCAGPRTYGALLESVTDLPYDSKSRPNVTGPPTQVQVQLYITSVTEVDEKLQKIGLAGYQRTWWTDPRLAYNSTGDGGCFDQLNVARSDWGRIWRPDLYFDNSLEETYGADMFFVYPAGRIWTSVRINHMIECAMFFGHLPYDEQRCTILIGSYSEDAHHVETMPFGNVDGLKLKACYQGTMAWDVTKVESRLEVVYFGEEGSQYPWNYVHLDLYLKRHSMFYIREYVVKGILFVLTSWCGFFISPNDVSARVGIGVIPLLTITTYLQAVYARLPTISYWTWLTSYLIICLGFSSIPIFEYALVCYLLRVEERRAEKLGALKSLGDIKALKMSPVIEEEAVDEPRSLSKRLSTVPSRLPSVIFHRSSTRHHTGDADVVVDVSPPSNAQHAQGGADSSLSGAPTLVQVRTLSFVEELGQPQGASPDSHDHHSTSGVVKARTSEESSSSRPKAGLARRISLGNKMVQEAWENIDSVLPGRKPEEERVPSKSNFAGLRLTPLQHKTVQEAWENIDREGSGDISTHELRVGLRNFGQFFTRDQVKEMFEKLGINQAEGMNKRKFLEFLANFDDIAPTNVLCKGLYDQPPSRQVDLVIRVVFILSFALITFFWTFLVNSFNNYNSEALSCES